MGSVHVRIGHYDYLIIAELRDIKVIAITLGKTAAEGVDHGLDLRIGQNLVDGGLLHIQYLTSDGQDGLILTVSGSLGAAACGISLHDKDLTLFGFPGFTVGQLSV